MRMFRRRWMNWVAVFAITFAASRSTDAAEPQYLVAIAAAPGSIDGPVYLADLRLPGLWKLTDGKLSLHFQGQQKFRTPLYTPRCLAFDAQGKLLVGDSSTREVYRMDDDGKPTPLTKGNVGIPMAIAVRSDGEILVTDLEIQRVMKLPAAGGEPTEFVAVRGARGLAIDSTGRVWVASGGDNAIYRYSADGAQRETIASGDPVQFLNQLVLVNDDTAYVADGYAKTIWKAAPGQPLAAVVQGAPLVNPVGLCKRGDDVLVVDPRAKQAFQLDATGKLNPLLP